MEMLDASKYSCSLGLQMELQKRITEQTILKQGSSSKCANWCSRILNPEASQTQNIPLVNLKVKLFRKKLNVNIKYSGIKKMSVLYLTVLKDTDTERRWYQFIFRDKIHQTQYITQRQDGYTYSSDFR